MSSSLAAGASAYGQAAFHAANDNPTSAEHAESSEPVSASASAANPVTANHAPAPETMGAPAGRQAAAPAQASSATATATPPPVSVNAFSQSPASGQTLHVTVGRSIFLDTVDRLKRIYIANPAVLDSYTANPHEIVITAKAPGASSVVVWDETGRSQAYQVSSDLDIEDLATSMKRVLPVDDVQVHGREGRVVLTGMVSSEAKSEAAVKLATLYTKDVANSIVVNRALIKQVKLKVRIVEVDRSKLNQFGINFFTQGGSIISGTSTQQFQTTQTLTPAQSSSGSNSFETLTVSNMLNFLLFSTKLNLGATLQDLESKQVLQILAEPNITTLSGEKANFLAGGEFPFPVVQGSSGGNTSITIQFRSYGVKLEFTPTVNADGTIELKVAPEVSALDFTNAVTISGYTIPAISTRRADTQVTVRSGQSFAISGLLDRRTTDLYSATPGIANVPILGQLFKSKGVTHSTSEILVVVSPEVVDPLSEPDVKDQPKPVIPFLSTDQFDKSLPKGAKAMTNR
jgi:pilus assembly protein CpaC